MAELKDSGTRREFDSGAVRDMAEGKGRFDLVPLDILIKCFELAEYKEDADTLRSILVFTATSNPKYLLTAMISYAYAHFGADNKNYLCEAMLEVAKHFEDGARKYGDNNWKKGLPCSCYIDSALRHMMKQAAGWDDEPHARAVLWNLMCCAWTAENIPELNDYAIKED